MREDENWQEIRLNTKIKLNQMISKSITECGENEIPLKHLKTKTQPAYLRLSQRNSSL